MATPKHLNFSSPCISDNSDSPFVSQEKSQSRRSASETLESNKMKKDSSLFKRIWNEEDELLVLKGLVDYRIKSIHESKIDWDEFYRFLGGSVVAKFSKDQVLSKIRKLKRSFFVHLERINERKDPNFTTSSGSEAFGFSMMLWGPVEVEVTDTDVDKVMLKEQEVEHLNETGVAEITENETAQKELQSQSGEEKLKEHEEVAIAESFFDNGVANVTEYGNSAGEAQPSKSGKEMLKEHEEVDNAEHLIDDWAAKVTENEIAQKAQQRENGEEMLRKHEEVAISEPLHDNGTANITENGMTAGEAQQSKSHVEMLEDHEDVADAEHLNENGAAELHHEVVVDKITYNGTARRAQQSENGEEMLKEHEGIVNAEPLHENEAAKISEEKTARKAQKSKNGKEMLREHEEVTNAETLSDNGAAKITENETTAGKESHDEDDELCAVRDAFETMMSQGLSDYQKKLHLRKLMNLGTGKRRQLSDEWKALCVEERRLNIKKLRFSVKLAEAANDR